MVAIKEKIRCDCRINWEETVKEWKEAKNEYGRKSAMIKYEAGKGLVEVNKEGLRSNLDGTDNDLKKI